MAMPGSVAKGDPEQLRHATQNERGTGGGSRGSTRYSKSSRGLGTQELRIISFEDIPNQDWPDGEVEFDRDLNEVTK